LGNRENADKKISQPTPGGSPFKAKRIKKPGSAGLFYSLGFTPV